MQIYANYEHKKMSNYLYIIFIAFLDPENMGKDTIIQFLGFSGPIIQANLIEMAAILNLCKLGIVPLLRFW